jgi:hypothetical protein
MGNPLLSRLRAPRRGAGPAATQHARAAEPESPVPPAVEPAGPAPGPADRRERIPRAFLKAFWQLVAGGLLIFGGAIAVFLGWYGAAHTRDVTDQIPYMISGGLLGSAMIVLGGSFYFSYYVSQLHAATRRQTRSLERLMAGGGVVPQDGEAPGHGAVADGRALVVAGGTWFHRPGCQILEGKAARWVAIAEALKDGLKPCRVCEPPERA